MGFCMLLLRWRSEEGVWELLGEMGYGSNQDGIYMGTGQEGYGTIGVLPEGYIWER